MAIAGDYGLLMTGVSAPSTRPTQPSTQCLLRFMKDSLLFCNVDYLQYGKSGL